jgi:hypothetical protein
MVLMQMAPMAADANVPGALRLRGCLDQKALRGALQQVLCRHDALRTRFAFRRDGSVLQVRMCAAAASSQDFCRRLSCGLHALP